MTYELVVMFLGYLTLAALAGLFGYQYGLREAYIRQLRAQRTKQHTDESGVELKNTDDEEEA